MRLDVWPPVTEAGAAALRAALVRADVDFGRTPGERAAWRRAGVREALGFDAVERPADLDAERAADFPSGYALSPLSTRGATRA